MEQEDLIERDLTLNVLLPEGCERTVTFHGSKQMMDVLVILCARYRLNPSDHVIELFSTNHNKIKFMPSSLIGCLEAELIVLKPKRNDVRKAPNIPVATVRLLINYRKSHKAVVRVSPRVPLAELMPAVCEKCEMDPKTTVLMRDSQSEKPLDLTKTLDDHGIRDLYAKGSPTDAAALISKDCKKVDLVTEEKVLGEKENRGLLSLFRRSRKSVAETASTATTSTTHTTSLVLKDQHANNTGCSKAGSTSSTPCSEVPKKRRAPPPPGLLKSQSVSCEQTTRSSTINEKQGVLSRASSTDSSLKSSKRRAPPPPHTSPSLPDTDKEKTRTGFFLEDTDEDVSTEEGFVQFSKFLPTCMFVPSSPLMASVLSEFTDRMKAMEQEDVSPKRSVTHSPPASTLPPVCRSLDGDPVVPPGCELLRHDSQRDGLTTFTVVPRRRPQSMRQYEFLLTMETRETINRDTGDEVLSPEGKSSEVEEMEMKTKEVMLEKADKEFEKVEETSKDLGFTEVSGNKLNIDAEDHLSEDEDEEGKDWIEEYRKRRRRFLSSKDERGAKLTSGMSRKAFEEEMVDEVPPQRQLSFCWEAEEPKTPNQEETKEDIASNTSTNQNPTPSKHHPQPDPTFDSVNSRDPYWEVNLSSDPQSSNSDTPPPSSSRFSPRDHHPNSVQSSLPRVSKSKPDPGFKLSSPNSASLFALAVSRRVQSLRNRACPLIPSARRIGSPTPPPQRVNSERVFSTKPYFQNLISHEFISRIPPSPGSCAEAPPTSTAPPSVAMTPQAKSQVWSSFSGTQLKNV